MTEICSDNTVIVEQSLHLISVPTGSADGDWQHVEFSDKCRFLMYHQDGRVRVRTPTHEAILNECVLPRVHAGGGGVTVWGTFH